MLRAPFRLLHSLHSVCKLSALLLPPLDTGSMWSNSGAESSVVPLNPFGVSHRQAQHCQPSRSNIAKGSTLPAAMPSLLRCLSLCLYALSQLSAHSSEHERNPVPGILLKGTPQALQVVSIPPATIALLICRGYLSLQPEQCSCPPNLVVKAEAHIVQFLIVILDDSGLACLGLKP